MSLFGEVFSTDYNIKSLITYISVFTSLNTGDFDECICCIRHSRREMSSGLRVTETTKHGFPCILLRIRRDGGQSNSISIKKTIVLIAGKHLTLDDLSN